MTTTFKMPTPDVTVRPGYFAYSEAVFEQALRDVLEQAADEKTLKDIIRAGSLVTNGDAWTIADRIGVHIRAIKEQIK